MPTRSSARIATVGLLLTAATATGQRAPTPDRPEEISLNDLFSLCQPDRTKTLDKRLVYKTVGILRRTAELDRQGRFALVHPVASCCPNGVAVGFCVRTDHVAKFKNGAQVIVCGRLRVTESPPALPRGYVAQIKLGILRRHVEIVASNIEVYDRLNDAKLDDLVAKLNAPEYTTFARAVRATGWDKLLRKPSYFTVLAPTEHAFQQLTAAERRGLFDPVNAKRLNALVRRHIVASWTTKRGLMSQRFLKTLGHDAIPLELNNGTLRIGGARILFQDTTARNGVVLALDRVVPEPIGTTKKAAPKAATLELDVSTKAYGAGIAPSVARN